MAADEGASGAGEDGCVGRDLDAAPSRPSGAAKGIWKCRVR
jgi:hypothetical protein